ncbi:hypothetical protein HAPAU_39840 [Halalkalicoccus paucihalophilus]|uniref:Uncharacterized protein n=1 Tax=Halalkalicoccus paucihalophilus TaxID=1008153 RepID=A0A151A8E8_9EURY|nr:hypothetical protein [Halalkalicoccus paucihalophilus]KYH23905.1 hypothetical protein HAPAU_39840 [Halalkalicoccus paucihalophilus]
MSNGLSQPRLPDEPPERGESAYPNIADDPVPDVPTAIEIDLGLDPVAYRYESWSEMAGGWGEILRSTAATVPDPDHERIRNVTPLVSLLDVEALVERMMLSGEVIAPRERTGAMRESPPP